MNTDFKIKIIDTEYNKIMEYVDQCNVEISGLGLVKVEDNGDFLIDKIFTCEQKCTSAETELTVDGITSIMDEIAINYPERLGDLKFWWHSHVNMKVFWSGTDVQAMEQLHKGEYLVSVVFNKRREMLGQVRLTWNGKIKTEYDNVPIVVVPTKSIEDFIQNEDDQELVEALIENGYITQTSVMQKITKEEKDKVKQDIKTLVIKPTPIINNYGMQGSLYRGKHYPKKGSYKKNNQKKQSKKTNKQQAITFFKGWK